MSAPPMYPAYMYAMTISIEERIKRSNSILPNVILRPSIKIPYEKPGVITVAVTRHALKPQNI